jgi:hypothetical protein
MVAAALGFALPAHDMEGQTIFLSHSLLSAFHIFAIMWLRSRLKGQSFSPLSMNIWVISFAAINFQSYLIKAKATLKKRHEMLYHIL